MRITLLKVIKEMILSYAANDNKRVVLSFINHWLAIISSHVCRI